MSLDRLRLDATFATAAPRARDEGARDGEQGRFAADLARATDDAQASNRRGAVREHERHAPASGSPEARVAAREAARDRLEAQRTARVNAAVRDASSPGSEVARPAAPDRGRGERYGAASRGVSTPDGGPSHAARTGARRRLDDARAPEPREAHIEPVAAPTESGPASPTRAAALDSVKSDAPAETTTNLPDAMLALLGIDVAPVAVAPPASADARASLPTTSGGAAIPVVGSAMPTLVGYAPEGSTSPALPASAPPAAAAAALLGEREAVVALAATALQIALPIADAVKATPIATEAFASLFAMDGTRESGTLDLPTGEATFALAALGSRGTGEGLGLSRSAVVLPPMPMPAVPEDGFDDGFGDRIVWMAEQRIGHAELRVSPEGAGAIDIRLQIEGNRVSAQFNAANPDVRQALESGMDRLRDLLGQHGMELAHSGVGDQRRPGHAESATSVGADGVEGDESPQATTTIRSLRGRGLVDEYA